MIFTSSLPMRRLVAASALCAAAVCLSPAESEARVFVGVGIGVPYFGYWPGYYPAPYYYPPPVYYAPPPVYYAPPQVYAPAQAGGRQNCYAGAYVCPMDRPVTTGSGCYCLGNGGQKVLGRAN